MAKIIIVIEKWTKLGTIRKVPNSFRPCLKSLVSVYCGEIPMFRVDQHMQVCVAQIELGDKLASNKNCMKIFNPRNWIRLCGTDRVCSGTKIATNSDLKIFTLHNWQLFHCV